MNATEARRQWSDVLDHVGIREETVTIGRNGKALVAIIPIADYEHYQALIDAQDVRLADASKAELGESVPLEALKADLGL